MVFEVLESWRLWSAFRVCSVTGDGAGGVSRGASWSASSVGPHEKPTKNDSGKKAENANGVDGVEDT